MKTYSYDPDAGLFLGMRQLDDSDIDPAARDLAMAAWAAEVAALMESDPTKAPPPEPAPEYLMPAHCTTAEPPECPDGHQLYWEGASWAAKAVSVDPGTLEAQPEEALAYDELRRRNYPPFVDYLDGIVKGDKAQVKAYVEACLAVKAKYPKLEPTKSSS